MAAFIDIFQGDARKRNSKSVWSFVNTTIEDEITIMIEGFLPLALDRTDGKFSHSDEQRFMRVYNRFFKDGKFLTKKHWETLQKMVVEFGYPPIQIPDDGQYWQPIIFPKKAPSAESWKENGISRTSEFEEVLDSYSNGHITVGKNVVQLGTDPIRELFNSD